MLIGEIAIPVLYAIISAGLVVECHEVCKKNN